MSKIIYEILYGYMDMDILCFARSHILLHSSMVFVVCLCRDVENEANILRVHLICRPKEDNDLQLKGYPNFVRQVLKTR